MTIRFLVFFVAVLAPACVTAPQFPEPPSTHPASPSASESPVPARSTVLARKPAQAPSGSTPAAPEERSMGASPLHEASGDRRR